MSTAPLETPEPQVTPESPAVQPTPEKPAKIEKYDLVFPENYKPSPGMVDAYTQQLLKHQLPQEAAQDLVNLYVTQEAKILADREKEFEAENKRLLEAAKADQEYGGANFDKNFQRIVSTLSRFATPEFVEMCKEAHLLDHPEFLRVLHRVSVATSEGQITPGGPAPAKTTEQEMLRKMYDKSPSLK